MKLTVTPEQYQWLQDYPMIWFSSFARSAFGRVTPGPPGEVVGEDGETVVALQWEHPNIDRFDQYILAVILKGKEYTDDIEDEATRLGTIMFRAVSDRDAFMAIYEAVKAGAVPMADAIVTMRQEAMRQGGILGVPEFAEELPDVDEVLEDMGVDGGGG